MRPVRGEAFSVEDLVNSHVMHVRDSVDKRCIWNYDKFNS